MYGGNLLNTFKWFIYALNQKQSFFYCILNFNIVINILICDDLFILWVHGIKIITNILICL